MDENKLYNEFISEIKKINERVWEGKVSNKLIDEWLNNFKDDEKIHMLYLLSNFLYYGSWQIREMLKSLYRDLYKYPIVESIRKNNKDTLDSGFIEKEFEKERKKTRFLGIGNPSESGYHLLYYFRQENKLPKTNFIHAHEIIGRERRKIKKTFLSKLIRSVRLFKIKNPVYTCLKDPSINRYIFIDDFSGSGSQGIEYSENIVKEIKYLNKNVIVQYFILFATDKAIENLKDKTQFDEIKWIFKLDSSFSVFSGSSRFYAAKRKSIDKQRTKNICEDYGLKLTPSIPFGFGNCELIIAFHHNTPDNTLPIFWYNSGDKPWIPIFPRYNKIYGE